MEEEFCHTCGLNHRFLGVEIKGRTLHRRAKASKHLLKFAGSGWAFLAEFFDRHREDFDSIRLWDTDNQVVYYLKEAQFDKAFRVDLGRGEQIIFPLRLWQTLVPGQIVTA